MVDNGIIEWYDSNNVLQVRIGTWNDGEFFGGSNIVMNRLPIPTKTAIAQFSPGQLYLGGKDEVGGRTLMVYSPDL
jgi:hypothetical protein